MNAAPPTERIINDQPEKNGESDSDLKIKKI